MTPRIRWLVLGLLLGSVSIASSQGGVGLFQAAVCSSIANPVTGSTWCLQTTAPNGLFYWNGSAFTQAGLGGPYAPTTFGLNGVLYGNGTGSLLVTSAPTDHSVLRNNGGVPTFSTTLLIDAIQTFGTFGVGLEPWGVAAGNTGQLFFRELAANGADYIGFRAPDAIATAFTLVWPTTQGTNGQCLGTDGANPAQTVWVTCAGGSGSGITTLGGLNFGTAPVQTFANDTNVTITSAVSTHTLGWTGTLAVARGGIGVGTLAANGALYGNGTGAVLATAAGAADTVLRVPGGGGAPAFGAVDVSKAAAITGLVRTANLGSGTANSGSFLRGDQTWSALLGTPTYNFVFNSDMEVWGGGAAAVPTGWALSGAGGSVSKHTTAAEFKTGTASAALVNSTGATVALLQNIAVVTPSMTFWQSQVLTCGSWVQTSTASIGFIQIFDGIGFSGSSFHSGGGTFEFLTVSRSLSSSAGEVTLRLFANDVGTVQYDSIICVLGSSIDNWQPSGYLGRKAILSLHSGSQQAATNTTTYLGAGQASTTETTVETPVPFRCVARNFTGRSSIAPSAGQTDTFTLRKNEADTALTFVVSGTAQQASDTTHEVVLAKGDRLATKLITSATAAATQAVTTLECEEVPEGI